MIGKVVQLLGVPFKDEFQIVYGINDVDFQHGERLNLSFGKVTLINKSPEATTTYIRGGYVVRDQGDGFKEIVIVNYDLEKEDKEDFLLVIIPFSAKLKTNAKIVAGRYSHEAILEMHAGDTIEVETGEIFMAVEAGNELFLLKKNR